MTDQDMWAAYQAVNPEAGEDYMAWAYGDQPDLLAELTRTGVKTATSSAAVWYAVGYEPMPEAGEYSVILNSRGEAVCVIRTTRVGVLAEGARGLFPCGAGGSGAEVYAPVAGGVRGV